MSDLFTPPPARLLTKLCGQIWALRPEWLNTWCDIMEAKLRDGKVELSDFAGIVIKMDGDRDDSFKWELDDNLAIIPIRGELTKEPTLFRSGTAYTDIRAMVHEADMDPRADAIMLDIDSPGGSGDGLPDMDEYLREVASRKPLYTFVNGQATSAAYWIGTPAKEIAAAKLSDIGSIGVRMVHIDWSRRLEKEGVKPTHLAAPEGGYKTTGNPHTPLDEHDRAYFQKALNDCYAVFVDAVATNRNLNPDIVRGTMARVMLADEAMETGLIDLVMSKDTFITHIKESLTMDLKEMKSKHPELVQEIEAGARKGMVSQADHDQAVTEATKAEANRQGALVVAVLGGEAAAKLATFDKMNLSAEQITKLADSGLLAKPEEADGGLGKKGEEALAAIKAAHGQEGLSAQQPGGESKAKAEDWPAMVEKYAAEHECSKTKAMDAIEKMHPGLRESYLQEINKKQDKQ